LLYSLLILQQTLSGEALSCTCSCAGKAIRKKKPEESAANTLFRLNFADSLLFAQIKKACCSPDPVCLFCGRISSRNHGNRILEPARILHNAFVSFCLFL
jgi:hypothetical protein